jgi:lipoprotein-releasing system ATP-binding protein
MITAQDIHKSYDNIKVLTGVDFSVKKGEVAAIVGKSGVGKSTLLHILGTLEKPDAGTITINNINTQKLKGNKLAQFRNQSLGFIFQFHHLLPEFTALENVCIPALISGESQSRAQAAAKKLLDSLDMGHRLTHKPKELSGGEQQRVAFARALINQPAVILADEPTGNLDENTAEELFNLIFRFREEHQQTFVIVTHNPLLAARCDQVFEMKKSVEGNLE